MVKKKWPKRKWWPIFIFGSKIQWTRVVEYVDVKYGQLLWLNLPVESG